MKDAADAILKPEQASYLEALQPARDALLAKMEARAAERRYPISDPEVATFLAITARLARPKLVVELGTNIGYGAIVLARAATSAKVVTIEYRADLCEEARAFIAEAGLSDRIEVRQGMALAELEKIAAPIDMAYVDCVKEEYVQYLELLVPRMSVGAILVADNVLWKGLVARAAVPDAERARTEALRAFNLALVQHPKLNAMVLPFGDGVGYAVKTA
jgi:predicted O-methyltransferase YrrM